jgi:hypothetical protein
MAMREYRQGRCFMLGVLIGITQVLVSYLIQEQIMERLAETGGTCANIVDARGVDGFQKQEVTLMYNFRDPAVFLPPEIEYALRGETVIKGVINLCSYAYS